MKYSREKYHRRSIRMRSYDYSNPGAYFVTICTWQKECMFGHIVDGEMRLNEFGAVLNECWNRLVNHYFHIELDECIIMPNHMHFIINIVDTVGAGFKPAPTMTSRKRHGLPEIVRALKTFSSKQINVIRTTQGRPVWQRNYYERVIRNEKELFQIREYIQNNPRQWDLDKENPGNMQT